MKLYSFDEHLQESLKNKKFHKEYMKLESWRKKLKNIIDIRKKKDII